MVTQGFLGGLTALMKFVNDVLGLQGVLGLLIGIILATFFSSFKANIFKLLIIGLIVITVIGLAFYSSNPGANIVVPNANTLINMSGSMLNQTNITK